MKQPIRTGALAILACAAVVATAQPAIPDGPIHIVVPYTTGTGQDVMARNVGSKLAEKLGRPAFVDNRAGASGSIGSAVVNKSAPNGATLMFNANTLVTSAPLISSLPYDPVRDFTPIAMTGWSQMVVVANPKTGFKSIQDLVAAARLKPGSINYGSPGIGTPNHLLQELLNAKTGMQLTHVPYRGTAPMISDLLGGQIQVATITVLSAAPLVKGGQVVALAMAGTTRSSQLPDVPTLKEQRIEGVDGDIWHGVFGPPGMSPDLVANLAAKVQESLNEPQVKAALMAAGMVTVFEPPAVFKARVTRDAKRWADLIRERGIRSD